MTVNRLLTYSLTVQRSLQRLTLSVVASDSTLSTFLQDVTQAYIQSYTKADRKIFCIPPPSLELPPDRLLSVESPLKSLPESRLNCFAT